MKKVLSVLLLLSLTSCNFSGVVDSVSDEQEHVHLYDQGTITKNATCIEEGEITYKCSGCDETKVESIQALGHTEVIIKGVEPTCSEVGYSDGKYCSTCHQVLVEQETLDIVDHNFENNECTSCGMLNYTPGLLFKLTDEGYRVVGYTGDSKNVVIPSEYKGKPVYSIHDEAFRKSTIESVSLPEGLQSIEYFAFQGCENLKEINLPSTLKYIGTGVFARCKLISSVTLPSEVTVDWAAFSNCMSLETVIIPDDVKCINPDAFMDCNYLNYNEFENGIYLGNENNPYVYLFKTKNKTFKTFNIHDDTRHIAWNAFSGCSNLTQISIPSKITSISDRVFESCTSLKTVNLPEGLKTIEPFAFYSCSSLESIVLPEGLESIGMQSFIMCSSLKSLVIPSSVVEVGESVIDGCPVEIIYYKGSQEQWDAISANFNITDSITVVCNYEQN